MHICKSIFIPTLFILTACEVDIQSHDIDVMAAELLQADRIWATKKLINLD